MTRNSTEHVRGGMVDQKIHTRSSFDTKQHGSLIKSSCTIIMILHHRSFRQSSSP